MKEVQFDDYGGVEVLEVRDVARPEPGPNQVLVSVRAAGINISEPKIRSGAARTILPATAPSGQGSDISGVVEEVGADVRGMAAGDEVIAIPTASPARPSTWSSRRPTWRRSLPKSRGRWRAGCSSQMESGENWLKRKFRLWRAHPWTFLLGFVAGLAVFEAARLVFG